MSENAKNGVYQLKNGFWAYRFSIVIEGKRYNRKKTTDELGNKLKTKRSAISAREVAIYKLREQGVNKPIVRRTFAEVFDEYCERGRSGKAYATIKKQDSLWKNHLMAKFGNKIVSDISVSEINDYLADLYYNQDYSYRYVESFLKMFYLILGQAYSKNYLSIDNYNKLCINKNSKISMPKLKIDEDLEIVVFNREELALLDNYFKGSNLETAYMLGRYCGLRVNECFGIKWDNVDVNNGTITIDRQMQYQDGLIKLVPLKTRNAKRTIYMCDKLKVYMQQKYIENKQNTKKLAKLRKQNQKIIEDINGSPLSSTELVNSLSDGKIQTINSIKYHAKEIQKRYNITFKYHYLRHTYGTMMAELNTPDHLLCKQLGHGSIQVTQRYYLGVSTSGIDILKGNLNKL
jgi:integrase